MQFLELRQQFQQKTTAVENSTYTPISPALYNIYGDENVQVSNLSNISPADTSHFMQGLGGGVTGLTFLNNTPVPAE